MDVAGLEKWVEWRFPEYRMKPRAVEGKFGLLFLMEAREPSAHPPRFALKTVRPDKLDADRGPEIAALFQREIALWLGIPPHGHVLPAIGVDLVRDASSATIPLVRMGFADDNLESWTRPSGRPEVSHRLIALAQACHGTQWRVRLFSDGRNPQQGHSLDPPQSWLRGRQGVRSLGVFIT